MQGALQRTAGNPTRGRTQVVECVAGPSGRGSRSTRPSRRGCAPCRAPGRRLKLVVRAGPVEIDEEDLMQAPDRIKWYEAKFCADDQPDWTIGRFLRSKDVAPGLRSVVLECEISRERVPLRNAYKLLGQKASIRVNQGVEHRLPVHNPPFPQGMMKEAMFNIRGDLFAEEVKQVKEPTSVMAELHLLVSREEAPDVYNMEIDDGVEVGPFQGTGIDLRSSPLMAVYRFPTVVIFVSGQAGIATAKALVEAPPDVASLSIPFRQDVRVYYKVPNKASACFSDLYDQWERDSRGKVKVFVTTTSFQDAFDDDDTLTYNPIYTGAILLTGGDSEAEKEALEVCKEAEISQILHDSQEQPAVKYLPSVPSSFTRWVKNKDSDEDLEEQLAAARAEAGAEAPANGDGPAGGNNEDAEVQFGNVSGNGNGNGVHVKALANGNGMVGAKR